MEFVAQLVERQIVALVVVGSIPIKLPNAGSPDKSGAEEHLRLTILFYKVFRCFPVGPYSINDKEGAVSGIRAD